MSRHRPFNLGEDTSSFFSELHSALLPLEFTGFVGSSSWALTELGLYGGFDEWINHFVELQNAPLDGALPETQEWSCQTGEVHDLWYL